MIASREARAGLRLTAGLRIAALAAVACLAPVQGARADAARFCIIPVTDGAPTEADIGQTWRITNPTFQIPGLPALVFTPINRGGQWTIDGNRRLVPYDGLFPLTYLDKGEWRVEPWSSRVVAIRRDAEIVVLNPGSGRFEAIENKSGERSFRAVYTLPRRRLTVAVGGSGAAFTVGDRALKPWLSKEDLEAHGVRGILSLQESETLAATIVVDRDRRIHILSDDSRWQEVGSIDADDSGSSVDVPASGGAVFIASRSVLALRSNGDGTGYSAESLARTKAGEAARLFLVSRHFGRVLTFDRGGFFDRRTRWRHLGPHGFEDIPGGDIGVASPQVFPHGRLQDLPTLGRALIEGESGLFFYDGTKIQPVAGGERARIGDLPHVYDLRTIGRVIVAARNGLFELTADGSLTARPMPFAVTGLPQPALADWPSAGVALISTRDGVFALDANLTAMPIPGGDRVGLEWLDFSVGVNPGTGEMVLMSRSGLFVAVDARRSRDQPCR